MKEASQRQETEMKENTDSDTADVDAQRNGRERGREENNEQSLMTLE